MLIELSATVLSLTGYFIYILRRGEERFPWYTRLFFFNKPKYPFQVEVLVEGYEGVFQQFCSNFENGVEIGSSVTVYSKGKKVVEFYGGYADIDKKIPFDKNTLSLVYSSGKFMESFVAAYYVDHGELCYDTKICEIWPEFKAGNKGESTLSDLLKHQSGLSYFNDPQPDLTVLKDSTKLKKFMEAHPHNFNGVQTRAYHGYNRGWILNQILQLKVNTTIGQLFTEKLNDQLEIEFYVGCPDQVLDRKSFSYGYSIIDMLANFLLPKFIIGNKLSDGFNFKMLDKDSPMNQVFKLKPSENPADPNHKSYLDYEIPSTNAHTNSNSLAKVAAILANSGTLNGIQTVSNDTVRLAISDEEARMDEAIKLQTTNTKGGFTLLDQTDFENAKLYGWCGNGGSFVYFDNQTNFAFSYVMNAPSLDFYNKGRAYSLLKEAYKAHLDSL